MKKTISELGRKEAAFLAEIASSKNRQFTIKDAIKFWGGQAMAWKKLRLLERKGWLARIERGKYLVIPLEAGPNRQWSEDPYIIASELVEPSAIAYWSAIRHWNWTEQIPRIVYVQTTTRKKNKYYTVFGVKYEFVRVDKRKFFGHAKEWRNGKPILVTDKEKTLVDCADDVERAGGIEELLKAVKAASSEISWQKLGEYVNRFPNRAVKKRLGFLIDNLVTKLPDEAKDVLDRWRHGLSSGIVPLVPNQREGCKIFTSWRISVPEQIIKKNKFEI